MRRLGFAAATVGALALLTGCVAAVIGSSSGSGTASDTRARSAGSDTALAAEVRSRIAADAALGAEALQVSVQGGTVTLRGLVRSGAERSGAERLARMVVGVAAVNNLLKVK